MFASRPPRTNSLLSLRAAVGGTSAAQPPDWTGRTSINQTVTDVSRSAARPLCSRRKTQVCRCGEAARGGPEPVLLGLTGPGIVSVEKGRRTGGGVASGFRNSSHCSTPAREENTSVEPPANQRPPTSSAPRPQAYKKGSAVSSAATGTASLSAPHRAGFTSLAFFSRPLFYSQTMADTQVDSGSDISAKDLKEKKLVEEKENGKDAATNGKENEENGEPDVDDEEDEEVDEEDEEDDGEGDEEDDEDDDDEIEGGTKRAAEDDEDDDEDDVETKKQKTDDDD